MMSVDFPSWKLALIERKRRQGLDPPGRGSLKTGAEATSMPPWKQEILFRKQQKRLVGSKRYDGETRPSLAHILLSPEDSKKCGGMVAPWPVLVSPVRDGALQRSSSQEPEHERGATSEERLPPISQNPILRKDLENRISTGFAQNTNGSQRFGRLVTLSRLSIGSHASLDGDVVKNLTAENAAYDETVDDEEVIYGKGFVSRLLEKFSYLSGREDVSPSGPRFSWSSSRGESSEDFSDGHLHFGDRSTKLSRKKANSLDDLLSENAGSHLVSENGDVVNVGWPNRGGEGSMVLGMKNIFENIAASPTSDANSLSPKGPKEPKIQDTIWERELPNEGPANVHCGVRSFSDSLKSVKEEDVGNTVQSHAIIDDTPKSQKCRSSLPLSNKTDLTTDTDVGINLREERNDYNKTIAQISSCKTKISAHSVTNLPEINACDSFMTENLDDGNFVMNKHVNEPLDLKINAGHPQIPKENEGHISQHSLPDQSQVKNLIPSEHLTTTKKVPPRPGLLLIRPASNVSTVRTDQLQMTNYNDVKCGEFVPAKKPVQKSVQNDDFDSDEFEESPDVSKYLRTMRFEFEGAGIRLERSLLIKSKQGAKLKTTFDDATTSVYEYPSEQSLIDSWPADSAYVDHHDRLASAQTIHGVVPASNLTTLCADRTLED